MKIFKKTLMKMYYYYWIKLYIWMNLSQFETLWRSFLKLEETHIFSQEVNLGSIWVFIYCHCCQWVIIAISKILRFSFQRALFSSCDSPSSHDWTSSLTCIPSPNGEVLPYTLGNWCSLWILIFSLTMCLLFWALRSSLHCKRFRSCCVCDNWVINQI